MYISHGLELFGKAFLLQIIYWHIRFISVQTENLNCYSKNVLFSVCLDHVNLSACWGDRSNILKISSHILLLFCLWFQSVISLFAAHNGGEGEQCFKKTERTRVGRQCPLHIRLVSACIKSTDGPIVENNIGNCRKRAHIFIQITKVLCRIFDFCPCDVRGERWKEAAAAGGGRSESKTILVRTPGGVLLQAGHTDGSVSPVQDPAAQPKTRG